MGRPPHIFTDEKFRRHFWDRVDVQPFSCWLWLGSPMQRETNPMARFTDEQVIQIW